MITSEEIKDRTIQDLLGYDYGVAGGAAIQVFNMIKVVEHHKSLDYKIRFYEMILRTFCYIKEGEYEQVRKCVRSLKDKHCGFYDPSRIYYEEGYNGVDYLCDIYVYYRKNAVKQKIITACIETASDYLYDLITELEVHSSSVASSPSV